MTSTWETAQPAPGYLGEHRAQQVHGVGVAPPLVGVGEVLADVAEAGRAEQRVDDRVGQDVGVGVALEAELARDLDAAEDQRPPGGEAVGVDADAGPQRQPIGSSRRLRPSNTHSSPIPTCSSSSSASS